MENNLRIVSRNIKLTDAIRSYIDKKLAFVERFQKYIESISIEITDTSASGQNFSYVININVKGDTLRSEEQGTDLYTLIDAAHDNLKTQLESYKDRKTDKIGKVPSSELELTDEESFDLITEEALTLNAQYAPSISKKVIYSDNKPLSIEEAIMQMEAIGHISFLFKNIENGKYSMVYKNQGKYILVEPENV